MDGSNTL